MLDDDDYFTDDICFDDQTLAILDHAEQKYLSQATKALPPSKRQKTEHEISIDAGSYGMLRPIVPRPPVTTTSSRATRSHTPLQAVRPVNSSVQIVPAAISRILPARNIQSGLSNIPHRSNESPQLALDRRQNSTRLPETIPINTTNTTSRLDQHELEVQLQSLQHKLEEMSKENKSMQQALAAAMSSKLAKEGEVTVLRQNAERVAQEHTAQVARLKSAREEADAKQARIQKELREETERLKTQLVFQQHEQESSHRPPMSLRSKRILKDASFTSHTTPSRLRYPNRQDSASRFPIIGETSVSQVHNSPHTKRSSKLPGFENAFDATTPVQLSRHRETQPTSKHIFPSSPSPIKHALPSKADINKTGHMEDTFMESNHIDADGDIEMPLEATEPDNYTHETDTEDTEDISLAVGPIDWKVEDRVAPFLADVQNFDHSVTFGGSDYV
ncbi:hypothetical protein H0H92_014465 [Tricholoma furcatifolium]|nr:hypothetical protein H0H92_014465 [Tricholoma furcatifolium]